jgi:hypothetical protein
VSSPTEETGGVVNALPAALETMAMGDAYKNAYMNFIVYSAKMLIILQLY